LAFVNVFRYCYMEKALAKGPDAAFGDVTVFVLIVDML
jgi:hypothetical protein